MTRTRTMRPLPPRGHMTLPRDAIMPKESERRGRRGRQRPTTPELAPWPDRWLYDHGFRDDRELPPDEVEP